MDPNDGVRLIFVTVVGVIMIMTDLLVSGVGRPAWAIAPPATLFLVPALGLGTDTGVINFLLIAVGYLGILVAEGLNTTARWTRGLSRDSADGFGTATPVVWRAAGYPRRPGPVLATIVLGVALPTLSLPGFGFGSGPGGNGPLQLTDPTLDLRRNLNQPDDRVVIEYQTRQPGGVYLRMASLPQLSAAAGATSQIRLNGGNELTADPGADRRAAAAARRRRSRCSTSARSTCRCRTRRAASTRPATGAIDANSLVVVNADNRPQDLRQLTYTVESVDIDPTAPTWPRRGAGTPPDDADHRRASPRICPKSIDRSHPEGDQGRRGSPAAKAAAIQAFLRSTEFTYSTERLPGSGYQALENFLLRDHKGYCEQFASAMAMMARVVGIPSRVSVGFLPGERDGDTWKVSIRDMHAWPELYFAGYGWVRFEPTPATVTGTAPSGPSDRDSPERESRPTTRPPSPSESTADPQSRRPVGGADRRTDRRPTRRVPAHGAGPLLVGAGRPAACC